MPHPPYGRANCTFWRTLMRLRTPAPMGADEWERFKRAEQRTDALVTRAAQSLQR
jgi:hypothetical protein